MSSTPAHRSADLTRQIIAAASAVGTRARLAPALASAWGLACIGVARFAGEPESTPIAIAAWIAAAVVLIVPLALWASGRRRGELALARS